ncbi:GNVR domain-containing protein [Xanthobacteraceae bacterium A53D]
MFMSLPVPPSRSAQAAPGSAPRTPPTGPGSQYLSLAEIRFFLRRHARTILVPVAVCVIGAALYAQTITPMFTARAQLIIDPRIPEQLRTQTGDTVLALDTAQVESQIAVLRSERIAGIVIDELNLREAPDFQPSPSLLSRLLGRTASLPPPGDPAAARRKVELFASRLDVRRAGVSYAIDLSFSSPDAMQAAEIANATAGAYIRDQLESRAQAARVGGDWLERRTLELRTQMNTAAQAVQEFRAGHDYRLTRNKDDSPNAPVYRNTLEELETTAQIYKRLYESFLQGYTESVQRQSFPVSDARILTPATPPLSKSEPRTKLIIALAALIGALAGFGTALVRHHLDRSVRSARQIREAVGVECLGSLPAIRSSRRRGQLPRLRALMPPRGRMSWLARLGSLVRPSGHDTAEPYFDEVLKPAAANFRTSLMGIKALIEMAGRSAPINCLGITSTRTGEGKSTLASNLATLFAAAGRRTLVIDANVRSGALSRKIAPDAPIGLDQVLNGSVALSVAVAPVARDCVDLLPAADANPSVALETLLNTDVMHLLVLEALQNYDMVIVDMPALLPVNSAVGLSALLDGVLLAVESGITPIDQLEEAAHWLNISRANVLGAVLTKA